MHHQHNLHHHHRKEDKREKGAYQFIKLNYLDWWKLARFIFLAVECVISVGAAALLLYMYMLSYSIVSVYMCRGTSFLLIVVLSSSYGSPIDFIPANYFPSFICLIAIVHQMARNWFHEKFIYMVPLICTFKWQTEPYGYTNYFQQSNSHHLPLQEDSNGFNRDVQWQWQCHLMHNNTAYVGRISRVVTDLQAFLATNPTLCFPMK